MRELLKHIQENQYKIEDIIKDNVALYIDNRKDLDTIIEVANRHNIFIGPFIRTSLTDSYCKKGIFIKIIHIKENDYYVKGYKYRLGWNFDDNDKSLLTVYSREDYILV
jgi:hypothetical protein